MNTNRFYDEEVRSTAFNFIKAGGSDGDGCIVTAGGIFDYLEEKFGEQLRVSEESRDVLDFVATLARHSDVELLGWDGIEFGWRGGTTGTQKPPADL